MNGIDLELFQDDPSEITAPAVVTPDRIRINGQTVTLAVGSSIIIEGRGTPVSATVSLPLTSLTVRPTVEPDADV